MKSQHCDALRCWDFIPAYIGVAAGCQVEDKVDESEYGKFGWVIDPEGNKVELWQPPEGK